jgi:hypothetical protein
MKIHSMLQNLRLKVSPYLLTFLFHCGLSILFSFVWYMILYGRFPLYLSHVNWIYNAGGDALQHQLGWEWFRQEPWRFPLGSIQAYGYPFGTSVTFMDSIPLLAIPFKLLSPWLEQNFQYLGIWELASVMGQMLTGMLILHEFTRSYPLKVLGASLLVLSPPMIFRAFYHSSLSAHWILLAAIWLILLEYRSQVWRGAWILLFAAAVLIHVYFIPMLIPLWMIGMFFHYKRGNKRWKFVFEILAVMGMTLLVGYSIGLFSLNYDSLVGDRFGVFSWNLNGFFNPFDFSSNYIKEMVRGTGGQFEGFSYLGLGNLLILPAALYAFLVNDLSRRKLTFLLPFTAAALIYILFALSNKGFLNAQPLWDIQLPEPILKFCSLFRTSGRFIWPVFYFLVLFGVIGIIRNVRFALPVLILAIVLQLYDIQPLYEAKKLPDFSVYQSPLQSEFWNLAATTNKHIVIIPAKKLTLAYEPIALFAVKNHFTLNLGYFARSDTLAFKEYAYQVWNNLKAKKTDGQTLYILTEPEWTQFAKANLVDTLLICEIDGYNVLFSAENELAKQNFDFSTDCSIPAP